MSKISQLFRRLHPPKIWLLGVVAAVAVVAAVVVGWELVNRLPQEAAKGCTTVAILLPETGPAQRWEGADRPELERQIAEKLAPVLADKRAELTLLYFNANGDATKQAEQADLALQKNACILIVGASDSKKAENIVRKAKSKHVPVIAYDRMIKDDDLAYYISFNSKSVGERQGDYIVEELGKKPNWTEPVKFIIINGDPNDSNTQQLRKGLMGSLESSINQGKLQKIGEDEDIPGWDGKKAAKKVQDLLKGFPDLKIVWVANDGMASEIIKVNQQTIQKEDILITGQDGTINSLTNIEKGLQGMTVCKDSKDTAKTTAELVEALFKGVNPSSRDILNQKTPAIKREIPSYISLEVYEVTRNNFNDKVQRTSDGNIALEGTCKAQSKKAGEANPENTNPEEK